MQEGLTTMHILSAENSFRRGLAAMVDGDAAAAAEHFQSAILIEVQHGVKRPQMRYLSYYGLSRAMAHGASPQAIQACETAARRDFFNPDLLLNLGRTYLLAGKTTKALAAFQRGLAISPTHKALLAEYKKVDRREPPPLGIVSRSHPLNKMLGKLRSSLRSRGSRRIGATRAPEPS
jgi:tetratricopeptide (TPR) repeat protein